VVVAEITQVRSNLVRMKAEARVDGALCAEGELMCSLVQRPAAAR
jgi:3-hydroxymyristoyl/3-hydroxydecanoyl-(acyl carrier protein) dehydratase